MAITVELKALVSLLIHTAWLILKGSFTEMCLVKLYLNKTAVNLVELTVLVEVSHSSLDYHVLRFSNPKRKATFSSLH